MAVKGIDVSKYQGSIDFDKVKAAGYDFVIINAGYGKYISQKDKYFDRNYERAKAAGLNVGAYWYSYAVNASEAEKEAKVFLEAVGSRVFEYPLYFDIEDSTQAKLSSSVIGGIVDAFCSYLEKKGYYAGLYSYASFLKNKVPASCRSKYDVWVANFDVSKPDYPYSYGMWQYSSTGRVSGISGECDLDYSYKNYPEIMKSYGLNGNKPESKRVLDDTGFKKGDKGLGVYALKKLLFIAKSKGLLTASFEDHSTFGEGTEKAVNQLLGDWGYQQNGIAGEKFISYLCSCLYD